MRDPEVRALLVPALRRRHEDEASTRIINEMDICGGAARIDVAVLNGKFAGWEIKSPRDRFDRLDNQIACYSKVCDEAWLVTDERHRRQAEDRLPKWWGIMLIEGRSGAAGFVERRPCGPNPCIDVGEIVRLLWRVEAIGILVREGAAPAAVERLTRRELQRRLLVELGQDSLRDAVREILKERSGRVRSSRPPVRPRIRFEVVVRAEAEGHSEVR